MLSLVFVSCTMPTAKQQDKDWTSASDMTTTSDRIIRATFVDSITVSIDHTDNETGVVSTTGVLFRQFEVLETLKGTIDAEEKLWVAFEPGENGEFVDGTGTPLQYWAGREYVLFLKGRLRPLEYPTDYGPVLWSGNGRPSLSEVRSGQLVFFTTRQYLDSLTANDAVLPEPDSAAPFTLTLAELAGLVK